MAEKRVNLYNDEISLNAIRLLLLEIERHLLVVNRKRKSYKTLLYIYIYMYMSCG